ncbi:MAG TPA: tetratricopeptide repeat-containing sensor histidine kinase [Chitinophagaceae bacterium]|nr:tetratricopeptide repeat-containing sensor histidine kinase [Chitinophagaceae bacterium]
MLPPLPQITNRLKASFIFPALFLFSLASVISFSGCTGGIVVNVGEITNQLQTVDSLRLAHRTDSAISFLFGLRDKYKNLPTPVMAAYYRIRVDQERDNEYTMNLYADSAVAVFNNGEITRLFPVEYAKALVAKGEACSISQKFNLALQFYEKAAEVNDITGCTRSLVLSKIAGIYYDQGNYRMAGRSWYNAYLLLDNCSEEIPQKLFMLKQGNLDNAGLAYDRASDLDSAAFCYLTDITFLNSQNAGKIDSSLLNPSRLVVYDNLGGLYIKLGRNDSAAYYLEKSISIKFPKVDGILIPPLLKLADLYTRTGNYKKAQDAFDHSGRLLQSFSKRNSDSKVKWHKLYAEFLLKNNKIPAAYNELAESIRLQDSLDKSNTVVKNLNVGKEFSTIQQQHTLEELKIKEKVNQIYLWAITIVVLLSLIIIFLAYRNLYKSRKSHKDTILHNKDLQKALGELEAANKNYLRIMRIMAHDLRNPLGGITGIASMVLREERLSDDAKRMVQLIEATGNHSIEMINELFRSGLAEENEPMAVQRLDISALLNDTVELLQFKANEKTQLLSFENDKGPVWSNANHEKLWRVFTNIIVNAIKFTQPGGEVRVSLKQSGNRVIINITDNGIGIPEKNKAIIFDIFTEAKRAGTMGEKPFGLGLSISKNIIEKHGGRIWFESVMGSGTTFYIELPSAG